MRVGTILLLAAAFLLTISGCATVDYSTTGQQAPDPEPSAPPRNDSKLVPVTFVWDPPTTGEPVRLYLWEADINGRRVKGTSKMAKHRLHLPPDGRSRMRVLGMDRFVRMGPYSQWSDWWPAQRDTTGFRDETGE